MRLGVLIILYTMWNAILILAAIFTTFQPLYFLVFIR